MPHRRQIQAFFLTAALAAYAATPPAATAQFDLPGGPAAGAPETVAVVALGSYQRVLDDVSFIGGLVDMPQLAVSVEGTISLFTNQKGLQGLDRNRPWGVLLRTSGEDFSPLVCLPVDDLDALLKVGAPLGVVADDMGDGVKSIAMQGQTLFIKSQGGWVFGAQNAAQLESLPADPATLLSGLVENYDIGVRLMAQKVPAALKELALDQLRKGMEEGLERRPEETNAEHQTRQELAEAQVKSIEQLVEELDQATIGIAVNGAEKGLLLDFRGTAVAGTKLADQMAMYEAAGTKLGGFLDKAASLSFATAYTIPENVRPRVVAEYEQQMVTARATIKQMVQEADLPNDEVRATLESALEDLLAAAGSMVRSGEIDMVGNVHLKEGAASAVGALRTPDPSKIDSALKKVAALAEGDPSLPPIRWGAENHEGVELHTVTIPVNDPQAEQVLGASLELAIGIGPDAAYFSVGPTGVASLKQAISASTGVTEVKPVEMSVALAEVMEFASQAAESQGQDAAVPAMIAAMLKENADSNLRVTVDGEPNGLRYRLVVEEGVLKAIGRTAAEVQAAQQMAE